MALFHSDKGSVNYTIVGSPTITDGIVSDLDGASLSFNDFPYSSANWEIGIKATTSYVEGQNQQRIIARSGSFYFRAFGSSLRWQIYNGSAVNLGDSSCTVTNYPFVKIVKTNSMIDVYLSADGKSYTKQGSNIDVGSATDGTLSFSSTASSWNGTLDLNHSYIIVNGQPWFGVCPIEVKHINLNSNSVNYLVKDNKLVFADSGLYLSGPTTYNVVGSPTIVDNKVSGFSADNYLQLSSPFNPSTATWELLFKVKTASISKQNIFHSKKSGTSSYDDRLGICFGIASVGKFNLSISSNGTSWVSYNGSYSVLANTDYWIKCTYDGSTYKLFYSLDGTTYTEDISFTGSNVITLGQTILGTFWNNGYVDYFLGSIDLKESYIKINGNLWFYGKTYATKNLAPVPAGYPLGNTTTPSIGWVDIPTQTFSPAIVGTTLGKDEVSEES